MSYLKSSMPRVVVMNGPNKLVYSISITSSISGLKATQLVHFCNDEHQIPYLKSIAILTESNGLAECPMKWIDN